MKSGPVFLRLADTFSILGNATRLKIIFALSQQELCVCDLAILLETTKSAVSHQLRLLRNARLVKYRREGKMSFYALDDEHIGKLFNQGLRHVKECPPRIRR
jgi:DNA-binding transcriptional ArsR family regulator